MVPLFEGLVLPHRQLLKLFVAEEHSVELRLLREYPPHADTFVCFESVYDLEYPK